MQLGKTNGKEQMLRKYAAIQMHNLGHSNFQWKRQAKVLSFS